jgi:hypothetical protein
MFVFMSHCETKNVCAESKLCNVIGRLRSVKSVGKGGVLAHKNVWSYTVKCRGLYLPFTLFPVFCVSSHEILLLVDRVV